MLTGRLNRSSTLFLCLSLAFLWPIDARSTEMDPLVPISELMADESNPDADVHIAMICQAYYWFQMSDGETTRPAYLKYINQFAAQARAIYDERGWSIAQFRDDSNRFLEEYRAFIESMFTEDGNPNTEHPDFERNLVHITDNSKECHDRTEK